MNQQHSDHAQDHTDVPSDPALRVKALESLLVEKGLVDPAALDVLVDTYESKVGPRNGAQVVARAWVDPAYKQRLLDDGTVAIAEFGFSGGQGEKLTVVENTPSVHNVIVCTLCSCYPWPVLGLPPTWYKSFAYRSRTVIDPRGVLRELGLDCEMPSGAFYVYPSVAPLGMDGETFCTRAIEEAKVALVPGHAFGERYTDRIRISYGAGMDTIRETLKRLKPFVQKLKK